MISVPVAVMMQGNKLFSYLGQETASVGVVVLKDILPLALIPPVFLYIGSTMLGWEIGAEEPIYLSVDVVLLISFCYFFALFVGFIGLAVLLRWMAPTYDANLELNRHLTVVATVATPLVIGSIAHLYPHIFVNMLVIIPALIWSMFLLYRGVPALLDTTPQQGMLMASSLIAIVLVAAVTLLGVTVVLWTHGFGPSLGL
ncbi:MAG: Yip1 family protein [Gammaproteobacteria bacterium]|nr:Yip1 family protein [Gammaproteobacteria bacterium]